MTMLGAQFGPDLARTFKAMSELMEGRSKDERLALLMNLYAIELHNHVVDTIPVPKGIEDRDRYMVECIQYNMQGVIDLIYQNTKGPKDAKSINEIIESSKAN